jgi:DNA polymerase-3 subunit delta'
MSWDRVIGQNRVKELFRRALAGGQVAHAYLLFGEEGVGKDALALEFAKALNCEQSRTDPCDACPSCKRVDTLQHPNIRLIVALPTGKNEKTGDDPVAVLSEEQVSALRQELAEKGRDPYHRIAIDKANFIKVNSVRELRREASLTGFLGGRKVFIVSEADMMNTEASNSLLKTLEEPPADTVLILTTSRKDQLLPTIISRCQLVRCESLSDEDIADALVKRDERATSEAHVAAQLANGSFTAARELVSEDMVRLRSEVVQFLRLALGNSPTSILSEIEKLLSSNAKPEAEQWLRLLQVWFHDAVALHAQRGDKHNDDNEDLRKFVERFGGADLLKASAAVERSIALVGKNVYLPLIFLCLALDLKTILYASSAVSLENSETS